MFLRSFHAQLKIPSRAGSEESDVAQDSSPGVDVQALVRKNGTKDFAAAFASSAVLEYSVLCGFVEVSMPSRHSFVSPEGCRARQLPLTTESCASNRHRASSFTSSNAGGRQAQWVRPRLQPSFGQSPTRSLPRLTSASESQSTALR
jgi:hypothetical protein